MRAGPLGGMVLGAQSLVLGYASPGGQQAARVLGSPAASRRRAGSTRRALRAGRLPARRACAATATASRSPSRCGSCTPQVRRMILRSGRWDEARGARPSTSTTWRRRRCSSRRGARGPPHARPRTSRPTRPSATCSSGATSGRLIGVDPELTPASELEARRLAELIARRRARPTTTRAPSRGRSSSRRSRPRRRPRPSAARGRVPSSGRASCAGSWATRWPTRSASRGRVAPRVARRPAPRRGAAEPAGRRSRRAPAPRCRAGHRYWDRVVEIGLAGATAEFRPPWSASRSRAPRPAPRSGAREDGGSGRELAARAAGAIRGPPMPPAAADPPRSSSKPRASTSSARSPPSSRTR